MMNFDRAPTADEMMDWVKANDLIDIDGFTDPENDTATISQISADRVEQVRAVLPELTQYITETELSARQQIIDLESQIRVARSIRSIIDPLSLIETTELVSYANLPPAQLYLNNLTTGGSRDFKENLRRNPEYQLLRKEIRLRAPSIKNDRAAGRVALALVSGYGLSPDYFDHEPAIKVVFKGTSEREPKLLDFLDHSSRGLSEVTARGLVEIFASLGEEQALKIDH